MSDEYDIFFRSPNIWRIMNICLFWIKVCVSKFFFSLRVYIYVFDKYRRDDWALLVCKNGEEEAGGEISFTAIKQRAGLIVNSIDRLRLKLELKLISFFLPFERDNKGDDWNASALKKKGDFSRRKGETALTAL